MRKLALLAVAMPIATFVHAQSVTLELGATWAADAVAELGRQTSQKLAVNPNVGRDLLVLFVKDRPAKEVMDQLASTLNAEWRMEGDTLTLTRFSGTENQEREQAARKLAQHFAKKVKEDIATQLKAGAFNKEQAKQYQDAVAKLSNMDFNEGEDISKKLEEQSRAFEKAQVITPEYRAMTQILSKMDLMQFATMPRGSRRVFSTSPTAMQYRLAMDVSKIAQQLIEDQKLAGADGDSGTSIRVDGGNSISINRQEVVGRPGGQGRPIQLGPPVQALLIAQRYDEGGISLNVQFFDANGNHVVSTNGALEPINDLSPVDSKAGLTEQPGEVQLSPKSIELLKAIKGMRGGGGSTAQMVFAVGASIEVDSSGEAPMIFSLASEPPKLFGADPSLREILTQPDKYEPLNFFVAESIRDLGKAASAHVIAVVPDGALSSFAANLTLEKPTTRQVEVSLRFLRESMTVKDGWLVIKPEDAPSVRDDRVMRVPLSKLQQQLDQTGTWTLDQRASYAATAPAVVSPMSLDSVYTSLLNPYVSREIGGDLLNSRTELRFFGQLDQHQRSQLLQGKEMTIGQLSASPRKTLDQLIFWSFDGPSMQQRQNRRGGASDSMPLPPNVMIQGMGNSRFQNERTTLLASGIPPIGTYSLQTKETSSAFASSSDGRQRVMGPQELAQNQLGQEGGGIQFANYKPEVVTYSGFKSILSLRHDLTFTVGPNYRMNRSLKDYRYDPKAAFGSYESLPQDFRTEAAKQLENLRKVSGRIRVGGGETKGAGIP